jgi:hypothetical protein
MPSVPIVQTTVAGTYLNTTSYYSYQALLAYENTYAHGGNGGYLWSNTIPAATIKAYDTFTQVFRGYTQLNSYARYVFSTFLEDWSGNTSATNPRLNSITLSDRSLSDLGVNSVDEFGTHGYLHIA